MQVFLYCSGERFLAHPPVVVSDLAIASKHSTISDISFHFLLFQEVSFWGKGGEKGRLEKREKDTAIGRQKKERRIRKKKHTKKKKKEEKIKKKKRTFTEQAEKDIYYSPVIQRISSSTPFTELVVFVLLQSTIMSGLASDEVAEDYKNSLEDLTTNDRFQISNLTVIAKENTEHAMAISRVLENHIRTVGLLLLRPRVLYWIEKRILSTVASWTNGSNCSL